MNPERAQELLDAEEERLRALRDSEAEQVDESLESATGELTSFDQHPADLGTETHDREVDATLLRSAEQGLEEVAAARERLREGTYGHCQVCEQPIPDERLEAQPTTRHCVQHQAEAEHRAGAPPPS